MTPETAERWANEMRLTPYQRKVWRLFALHEKATIPEMIEGVYGDREDGGPLRAEDCIKQFMHSIKKKLGARGTIVPVHLFELRLNPGRR